MVRNLHPAYGAPSLVLLLLLSAGSAAAEVDSREPALEPGRPAVAEDAKVFGADERVVETLEQKGGQLGYSLISVEGYGGRASSYGFLHSSRSGGLFYRTLEKDGNFELEGNFLNENDYHGDLLIDYKGDYRLHLRTESLYHNLDRELLFNQDFTSARVDPPHLFEPATYGASQDPPANYGVSVTQDLAEFRYRLHNFPLHVNLGYWRLVREGTMQQRFADTAFEGGVNRIYAQARPVDQQTQEGRVGMDAHLGWVDLIYDFRVRVFEDKNAIPTATYAARSDANGNPDNLGGVQQHNENPDSRYLSHTVKLHTSLSGGIVGSASYSIDQRENLSRLTDTSGVKHAQVTLQNAAGDLVYTPCKEFSLAVKYRRQELEHDNGASVTSVTSVNFANQLLQVKPAVNSTKDIVLVNLAFKPLPGLTLNTEYRGEVVARSNVSDVPATGSWALPATSSTQKGSVALLYHPVKGMRVTGKYSYTTTDHPSYGNSFEQQHEGQLLASYTAGRFGASANLIARREWNDRIERFMVNFPFTDPLGYTASSALSRDRATENVNVGLWFTPVQRLTLSANYAWLHNSVDQGVLFNGVSSGPGSEFLAASNYTSRAHVYGVNATLAATEECDLSLMLQQIRSQSVFMPRDTVFAVDSLGNPSADTSGIRELTRQDTVISQLALRGEYRFTRQFSGRLEYSLQDYDEKNPVYSAYNGTVHAVAAYLTAKW